MSELNTSQNTDNNNSDVSTRGVLKCWYFWGCWNVWVVVFSVLASISANWVSKYRCVVCPHLLSWCRHDQRGLCQGLLCVCCCCNVTQWLYVKLVSNLLPLVYYSPCRNATKSCMLVGWQFRRLHPTTAIHTRSSGLWTTQPCTSALVSALCPPSPSLTVTEEHPSAHLLNCDSLFFTISKNWYCSRFLFPSSHRQLESLRFSYWGLLPTLPLLLLAGDQPRLTCRDGG